MLKNVALLSASHRTLFSHQQTCIFSCSPAWYKTGCRMHRQSIFVSLCELNRTAGDENNFMSYVCTSAESFHELPQEKPRTEATKTKLQRIQGRLDSVFFGGGGVWKFCLFPLVLSGTTLLGLWVVQCWRPKLNMCWHGMTYFLRNKRKKRLPWIFTACTCRSNTSAPDKKSRTVIGFWTLVVFAIPLSWVQRQAPNESYFHWKMKTQWSCGWWNSTANRRLRSVLSRLDNGN